MCNKQVVVVSGINLVDGGALSIYYDCLQQMKENGFLVKYRVIALVNNKTKFDIYKNDVELVEFPKSKKSWFLRLYYEYIFFYFYSLKVNVYVWLSLHDMTPNIKATKRYVYCHNPSPFNKMRLSEAKYGLKYYLFSKFYKYLYKINIRKNTGVIVQQAWMRNEFKMMYGLKNVIVARPSINVEKIQFNEVSNNTSSVTKFIYPSYPRYYKNFESVCQAAKILIDQGISSFSVQITLDGTENKYSKELFKKYRSMSQIIFSGLLDRVELFKRYKESDCLLFLSKLETWGMPIIEYKNTGKSMIVSDLPYAHETVGNYKGVVFANPDEPKQIADFMKKVICDKKLESSSTLDIVEAPFATNWKELFDLIFD